ncbi:MAG: GFA family protein [Myxococcales bacterium]|nr:GFA family protein [Myxococcales bacterium]
MGIRRGDSEGFGSAYAAPADEGFIAKHSARCHCGAVRFEYCADPVDAKICHCRTCQTLHGAPMQWAAIFHKRDVRLVAGFSELRFYNSDQNVQERRAPCKVSCRSCGTLLADEGRNMWLAFPTLFEFGAPPRVPEAFKPTCHIFYGSRVVSVADDLPKWSGHKDVSRLL